MQRTLLILATIILAGPAGLATPTFGSAMEATPAPSGTPATATPAPEATPPPPCRAVDIPFFVDECGDTMIGDLTMQANVVMGPGNVIRFAGGDLAADPTLTFAGQPVCLASFHPPACGDVTAVFAGMGLLGGGTSGDLSLAVDAAKVQSRVTGTCAAGNYVRVINQDGTVTCGADADTNSGGTVTSITAGSGLSGGTITTTGTIALLAPSSTTLGGVRAGGCTDKILTITTSGGLTCAGSANTATGSVATVGGGFNNAASGTRATVAGGEGNAAKADATTVSGGYGNTVTDNAGTIGGGINNRVNNYGGTVAGGADNTAGGYKSSVGGGANNNASYNYATIAGGILNQATGEAATVPGGQSNTAAGTTSLAAGFRAKANHAGAFVWGDSTAADFASTGANQFSARATGGFRFIASTAGAGCTIPAGGGAISCTSDRNLKADIAPLDPAEVLRAVRTLPLSTWRYATESPGALHIGPMAQDFHAAFGVGDDRSIGVLDEGGVALAAIQGLHQVVEDQQGDIAALRAQLDAEHAHKAQLEQRLAHLEAALLSLQPGTASP